MVGFRLGVVLGLVSVALLAGSATAKPPRGEKPGTGGSVKWNYQVTDGTGNLVEKGFFFAKESMIINKGGKKIGTYEDVTPTSVKATIFEGKLEGQMELRRDSATGISWHGKLQRPGGGKYNVSVGFEKLK